MQKKAKNNEDILCILRPDEETFLSWTDLNVFKLCHLCLLAYVAFKLDSVAPLQKFENCHFYSINFFFTRDESHCYDDVHILRDTASYLQRAVKQSYISPNWSKIKPCSPQIRRSSGFQPSLRSKAEKENKFWDLSFCRLGESCFTEVPKTSSDPRQCIIESIPMSIPWQLS